LKSTLLLNEVFKKYLSVVSKLKKELALIARGTDVGHKGRLLEFPVPAELVGHQETLNQCIDGSRASETCAQAPLKDVAQGIDGAAGLSLWCLNCPMSANDLDARSSAQEFFQF
jgi:hypothetical protein